MILSDDATAYIRAHYGSASAGQIAAHLGVPRVQVYNAARGLGLATTRATAATRAHDRRRAAATKARVEAPAPCDSKSARPDEKPAEKIGWGRHTKPHPFPADVDAGLRDHLARPDHAPEVDPPVRFMDRLQTQCPAIRDHTVPILERLVCGAPKAIGDQWCAWHAARLASKPLTRLKGLERLT